MRLINVATLKLEEFLDGSIPPYAILSHTWGVGELSYRDFVDGKHKDKEGYVKIKGACQLTANWYKYNYVWIDTCCIDKSSSAELSEAINSMFQWYRSANVCFAYLSDVQRGDKPTEEKSQFRSSRWFTRGWTLQELLAPERVDFYNASWLYIGSKVSLSSVVREITRIPVEFLRGERLHKASVANRMAWAARRRTTRREDIAYCLLGIFGIHMPLLYGEGDGAFKRLQLEILKENEDESIFAWEMPTDTNFNFASADTRPEFGFLACSPADFAIWEDRVLRKAWPSVEPSEMTNRGLRTRMPLFVDLDGSTWALLNCTSVRGYRGFLGIPLTPVGGSNDFARRQSTDLRRFNPEDERVKRAEYKTIYIKKAGDETVGLPAGMRQNGPWRECGWIYIHLPEEFPMALFDVQPHDAWRKEWQMVDTACLSKLGQSRSWRRIILRFGQPKPCGPFENEVLVVLEAQTWWGAICSPEFLPPPFRLYVIRKCDITLSLESLLTYPSLPSLLDGLPDGDTGDGQLAATLDTMMVLGRRFYVINPTSRNVKVRKFSAGFIQILSEVAVDHPGAACLLLCVILCLPGYIASFGSEILGPGSGRFPSSFLFYFVGFIIFLMWVKVYLAALSIPIPAN
ncbi:heterokaryon incompatibility protein-domain-containing protein [Apodospora peruviana]|uniref:Heterokaryon incompatibility protein-domain-containing protein n=1 Tax=Apodospora peruviana TaxID=516989 RepID=A0AAE0LZ47_9PEZI|nr:heterokaryon incompatibility protein-domain-containing protein [Apodospora peruviana]